LQERVAELEDAQRKLEQQGADLVRLAAELKIASDRAKAASRAKSEFLAAMSHELRTPLNAVIGFSDIIKSENFGPVGSVKYRGYAEDINASGHHLLELINDILDLSKVESGSDELHEEDVAVPKVARSVLNLVKQRAEKGEVALELDLAEDAPLLHADRRKLTQILLNLLTNAIKFSHDGGKVTLRTRLSPDGGYLFEVVDTGIGMAPEDIPKALSQFGQVGTDFDHQLEGTGLGLPLTKAFVEMHQGTLDLRSEVSVGTTASVHFPAERTVWPQDEVGPSGMAAG
jgi:signal transduction histidine kinase